jgi:hypothetical protein
MGYDLHYLNNRFAIRANIWLWGDLLKKAVEYGWDHPGTIHKKRLNWNGEYGTNDGAIITQPDLFNLSLALNNYVTSENDISEGVIEWVKKFQKIAQKSRGLKIL